MKRQTIILSLIATVGAGALYVYADDSKKNDGKPTTTETSRKDTQAVDEKDKVRKTDEEWKKILTPEQFRVARKAGTERPFTKSYDIFKHQPEGTYFCVCCDAELFTSSEKFDSGCGWPSFYDESKARNIGEKVDISAGMKRVEVICKKCDAHLGHVFFNEGFDTPTNKRYCINAVSMKFLDARAALAKKKADEAKANSSGEKKQTEKAPAGEKAGTNKD